MENGNLGNHPFGENPFGNPELGILQEGGNEEEKVCPHCGTDLAKNEKYCMICGMSVEPVLKKDYQRAVSDGDGSNLGSSAYGGNGYGGSAGAGYGSTAGAGYGSSYGSKTTYRAKKSSSLVPILIFVIGLAAVAVAFLFFRKGLNAPGVPQSVTMHRTVISELNGQKISSREELITVNALGDVVTQISLKHTIDSSNLRSDSALLYKKNLIKKFGDLNYPEFISYDVVESENEIVITVDFKELDKVENLNILLDNDLLEFKDGKERVNKTDHISYKAVISELKAAQYKE